MLSGLATERCMANRCSSLIHYVLDASASQFTAQISVSNANGPAVPPRRFTIEKFSGFALLGRDTSEGSQLRVSIDPNASGFMVDRAAGDQKLAALAGILETKKHPEIVFEGTQVSAAGNGDGRYRALFRGQLTVRGVTRPLEMETHILYGDDSFRAYGDFQLCPDYFGLSAELCATVPMSALAHVKFMYFITGRKQD